MSNYHMHHIIPRHMGGTDDPSNLVRLTVEEHAEAHRILYEQYGLTQDYCAWKGLTGQIGKDEILAILFRSGSSTQEECFMCGRSISKHNMSRHLYSCSDGKIGTKANATRKGLKINSWQNRNELIMITNGEVEKFLDADQPIPEGWRRGRKNKGHICVTNGTQTKRVLASQIPEGWWQGRHYSIYPSK